MTSFERKVYHERLIKANNEVIQLLEAAIDMGRRTDCLRVAAQALEGALRNVEEEDKRWPGESK